MKLSFYDPEQIAFESQQKALRSSALEKERRNAFLSSYLETIPQGVYQSWLGGQDKPLQNYYGNMFGNFYNEYQGALAKGAQGGTIPTMDFSSFLNTLDLQKRYNALMSRQKGFYHPSAAPRTRFLNY